MDIDIVNKEVAQQLLLKEANVKLINQFYWQKVKQHLYSYDHRPLNIDNVCVIFPNPKTLKKAILRELTKLRALRKSKKFILGSIKHQSYLEAHKVLLRNYLKVRKACKFTN